MIIILHGPDTFRSWRKLSEIKQKFIRDVDKSSLNITVLEKETISPSKLKQELNASPFLAKRRMVIVKNCFEKKIQPEIVTEIESHSEKPEDRAILVIYQSTNLPAAFVKSMKGAIIQNYNQLEPNELNAFVIGEVKLNGGSISPSAANYLTQRIGNDTWRLSHEINKLISYSNGKEITIDDINNMTEPVINDSVFNLIDAIATQQNAKSLELLERQIKMDENPIGLFSLILRQFRILLQIKELLNSHPNYDSDSIAKYLEIHPYAAKKSLQQSKFFSLDQLREIFLAMIELDIQLKTSGLDPELSLDYFLLKQKQLVK